MLNVCDLPRTCLQDVITVSNEKQQTNNPKEAMIFLCRQSIKKHLALKIIVNLDAYDAPSEYSIKQFRISMSQYAANDICLP